MEIINFVGQKKSNVRRGRNFSPKNFSMARLNLKPSKASLNFLNSTKVQSPEKIFAFNFDLQKFHAWIIFAFKKILVTAYSAKKFFLQSAKKIPIVLPGFFASALIFWVFNFFSSHSGALNFSQKDFEAENRILNSAMQKFAMNDGDFFDSDGNVLDSGGKIVQLKSGFLQPVTFKNYTVKSGDTISTIARKFSLGNISTLISVNEISNVRTLLAGQKLKIPSFDGIFYAVKSGESLNSLSVKFSVAVEDILDANDLESQVLFSGQKLFIPGARMESSALKKAMGELFAMPITAQFRYSSMFGLRADPFTGLSSRHTGVDMACPMGTPIKASRSGKIVKAGWHNIYGNYVIIDHDSGYQTLYGHMSKIKVKQGQQVAQGTIIGLVGSTGYSTGPHLHFTVFKNGNLLDPLSVLKKK